MGSGKPYKMMNGPDDLAMRLVCGLRQMLVEQKKVLTKEIMSAYGNIKAPFYNPEAGVLYFVQDPEDVDLDNYDCSVDVLVKAIPNQDSFSRGPTYELLMAVDGKEEMQVDDFIKKYSS